MVKINIIQSFWTSYAVPFIYIYIYIYGQRIIALDIVFVHFDFRVFFWKNINYNLVLVVWEK